MTDKRTTTTETPTAKTYVGFRAPSGARIDVIEGATRRALRHVVYHSPTGMEWGFSGSGPADTALSILADALGERVKAGDKLDWEHSRALQLYPAFKEEFIARAPWAGFQIPAAAVLAWVERMAPVEVGV